MTALHEIVTVNLNTAIDRVLEARGVKLGAHQRVRRVSRVPAGKAVNVSHALAALNVNSIATGFVGAEQLDEFNRYLKGAGPGRITPQLLTVAGDTRENITVVDRENNTDTHLREAGFEIADVDFDRILRKVRLLSRDGMMVMFCGSLPDGVDTARLRRLLRAARGCGAQVGLDAEGEIMREALGLAMHDENKSNEDGANFWDVAVEQPTMVSLIKPNRDELAQMTGHDTVSDSDAKDAGRQLARRVRYVVVTHGAAGAWLFHGDDAWVARLDIDPEKVRSTVGCGDCLIAGFLQAMKLGKPPQDMLRQGVAVATANALGSTVAEFDRRTVAELAPQVDVGPL